ncbi:MAG: hypothetical protein QMC67_07975 [Candidatus Wallbacteria bacterium]
MPEKEISVNTMEATAVELKNMPEYCPSCGRKIDGRPRCPYCCTLTEQKWRISLFHINLTTLVLFAAAIVYCVIAGTLKPHYTDIVGLNESKNFERVRVLGKVNYVSQIKDRYEKRTIVQVEIGDLKNGDSDDYNTKIKVKAEGEVAADLIKKQLIPDKGDIVDVSASLYAGKGYRVLSLGSADFLRVVTKGQPGDSNETTIGNILAKTSEFNNKIVSIKEAVITKKTGKFILEVSDPDLKSSIMVFGADPSKYEVNQKVSISGRVVYYEKGDCYEIKVSEDDMNGIVPLK